MCLWLITACLGLLPAHPSPPTVVVVQGVPTPILQPTTAATMASTATPNPTPTSPATTASTAAPPPNVTTGPPPPPTNTTASPTTTTTSAKPPSTPTPTTPTTSSAAPTTTTTTTTTAQPIITAAPTTKGPLPIDPRLGTTPGSSAAWQASSSMDMAVKFPKERRVINTYNMKRLFTSFKNIVNDENKHHIRKRQSCRCVPSGTCVKSTYGAGMIDIRIVTPGTMQCPTGQEYCCGSTIAQTTIACGTLQSVPSTSVTPTAGQANFGEYPWQALILTKQNDYIAGGVLIDQLNVITVTHRLLPYVVSGTAPNVKVRLGEWDASGTYEPIPFKEYTIQKVFSHASYNPNTLQYDITVLRLSSAVPFTPMNGSTTTINRACLPASSASVYNGLRCWVSGWGKNMFGTQGQYQQIMKKVEVPIVAPAMCQAQMQAARLGTTFVLDITSFICAGGEADKDACTGDGGSGLTCQVNGQWVVVGLVAWGLGCANANVSAAYVNVAALLPWIQQQVATT